MDDYKIKMRMQFTFQRPEIPSYMIPKIEPLVYGRPLKEKLFILKRIGLLKTIQLWKFEKGDS